MKIFEFWARNTIQDPDAAFPVTCYGYSNSGIDDALRVANERAQQIAETLRGKHPLTDYNAYADRPQREEIVERLESGGDLVAVITRNSYGALVLNSARVLFGDIDLATDRKPGIFSWFKRKQPGPEPGAELVQRIQEMVGRDVRLAIRLYRTCAGFRFAVTSRLFEPTSSEGIDFLENLKCDPLYVRLCKSQECFRARLTPKCWRMRIPHPDVRYPYVENAQRIRLAQWVERYDSTSRGYSTCAVIGSFGDAGMHAEARKIIELHDHFALNGDHPLA